MRYERLCILPVDVEGQGAEVGCRSNNIREKEPPSARVRENKRTQNHYQDDPKTKKTRRSQQIKSSKSHAAPGGLNKEVSITQDNQPHHNKKTLGTQWHLI